MKMMAHSAALVDLNRSRQDLPMENALARVMSTMLGADTAMARAIRTRAIRAPALTAQENE